MGHNIETKQKKYFTAKELILMEVEATCTMHSGRHIKQILSGLQDMNQEDGIKTIEQLADEKKITLRDGRVYQRR